MKRLIPIVALAVTLAALLAAGAASAATTTNTIHWNVRVPPLDPGIRSVDPDGTVHFAGSVLYCQVYLTTGPDGARFPEYAIVCLDRTIPPRGSNTHAGDVVFLAENPRSFWVTGVPFWTNLAGHTLLWSGTWDGITRNKQNHDATLTLTGESTNAGYSAVIQLHCGQYMVANAAATNYVDTAWNGVALVTGP